MSTLLVCNPVSIILYRLAFYLAHPSFTQAWHSSAPACYALINTESAWLSLATLAARPIVSLDLSFLIWQTCARIVLFTIKGCPEENPRGHILIKMWKL